jgi:catechol 2,3-dioxygenase
MSIQSLRHIVLRVRNLAESLPFYRDALGLKEVAWYGRGMVFLSAGEKHHDIALQEVGPAAPDPEPNGVGLYHVAFKVGDSLDDLRRFRARLREHNIPILGMSDHKVSQALYLKDPDGIEVEVYVDADPTIWKEDPKAVATIRPLVL